ncbi:MAG: YbhB/YbcL family Raf kinase inhibitor-like protein [Pseudomonadales bacterium]|nr:YbhB/YbcL family Raf kinase inhibitor-like protein [Pseudomonadales bacterium]
MKKYSLITIMLLAFSSFSHADGFTLESPDVQGQLTNDQVFNGFGCNGKNISPRLTWKNVPKGTKSIAITLFDADAPTGSGFWHWLIFDIPADVTSLKTNAGNLSASIAPKGSVQSTTSFGTVGFGGSCPPKGHGPHQYTFTAFALDVKTLGLSQNTTPAMVGFNLSFHTLAKASVVLYNQR